MWQNITETLIYFLYNEDIQDKTLVNLNLLYAADKYNVPRLVEICAAYLKLSLYVFNVLDILVAAHHGLAGSFQGCLKLCLQKKRTAGQHRSLGRNNQGQSNFSSNCFVKGLVRCANFEK